MRAIRVTVVAVMVAVLGTLTIGQADTSAWSNRVVAPSGDVRVNADDRPDGSLYVFATSGEAIITGSVDGDLYCVASDRVRVEAKVSGSIHCASLNISLKGEVGEGARLAAQQVEIDTDVSGDVSVLASSLGVKEGASIAGDLNGSINKLTIDGSVGGILGTMRQVDINSRVGSMDVTAQSISLGSSAEILGDVNYQQRGDSEIKIDESKVEGSVTLQGGEVEEVPPVGALLARFTILTGILLSIAAAALIPFHRFYGRVYRETFSRLPVLLLIGFMTLFAAPVALLFLALTAVGLPFAVALAFLWISLLIASTGYLVYAVASQLRGRVSAFGGLLSYVAAILVVGLLASMPIVGFTLLSIGLMFGSGSLIYSIFTHGSKNRGAKDKQGVNKETKNSKKTDK